MKNYYRKEQSVAFTGHRSVPKEKVGEVRMRLRAKLILLYQLGFRNFISGMALGFDMIAAEEVIRLKEELSEIRLIVVVPYEGQSERWSPYQKKRHEGIMEKADKVEILSQVYFNGVFLKRNDFMLSQACGLIAYFDGKPKGGTFYTCRKAKLNGMDIINLYG